MPISTVRGTPIEKILSMRAQPTQQRRREQPEKLSDDEAHTSDLLNRNDYSECSIDSDLAILPPPRRSLASQMNPRPMSSNRKLILKCIICLLALFLFLHFVPRFSKPKMLHAKRTPTILLWNEETSTPSFFTYQCRCAVTNVHNDTNMTIDAIIVNADRPYSLKGIDAITTAPNFLIVFAAKQPLSRAKNPITRHGESDFNYTMTYRLDSDLVWTDYYFSSMHNLVSRLNKFQTPEKQFMLLMPTKAAARLRFRLQLKQHMTVYMAYELNDASRQFTNYLEQLRQHMHLHVIKKCRETNECIPYRFMLIYESSCCPDYLHPQFYMALVNFVVPVLLGDCNISNLVPPGSYINGAQFSPPELANHLNTLSAHPAQYAEFFWWHAKYQIQQIKQPYCALCSQLHRQRGQSQPYAFLQWWTLNQCPDPSELRITRNTRE